MFAGPDRRLKIITLLTMCFALFMAMLDNTVVNIALPTLHVKLHAGTSELQWIVDGYVLAFASLLLTGGILGDRFGRKRMFLSGLFIFTLFSLLCGLSANTTQLIIFRYLQGIGGALLIPGTLSIITVTFPPRERAQALGVWAGVSGIALAAGPTLGGYLVEHAGWESVFFLNVPIGIVGFLVAVRTIRESRSEYERKLDITGLVLGTAGLFATTYGLIQATREGWTSPIIIGSLATAVVLIGSFLAWERRTDHAMMPLSYFRIPAFSAGNAVAFAISLGMFGTWFFMSLYMQTIRGYSAFSTGVRFLPMTLMIIATAPNAGRFASKHGSRWPMAVGLSCAASGLFILSRLSASTPYNLMIPVFMLMGFGMAATMAPMTAAVMNSVGPERAGLGSSMTNTSREVGGVFGIALLGTLLSTKLKAVLSTAMASIALPAATKTAVIAQLGQGQTDIVQTLDPATRVQVLGAYRDSFLSGFHLTLGIASIVLFLAAAITVFWIPAEAAPHVEGAAEELVAAH